jgi:hypothetical protein
MAAAGRLERNPDKWDRLSIAMVAKKAAEAKGMSKMMQRERLRRS